MEVMEIIHPFSELLSIGGHNFFLVLKDFHNCLRSQQAEKAKEKEDTMHTKLRDLQSRQVSAFEFPVIKLGCYD